MQDTGSEEGPKQAEMLAEELASHPGSQSLVKLATRMRVISRHSMGISICPHYVHIRVMSRTTELMRVKEKPCVDVLYICVYARLKVYVH